MTAFRVIFLEAMRKEDAKVATNIKNFLSHVVAKKWLIVLNFVKKKIRNSI